MCAPSFPTIAKSEKESGPDSQVGARVRFGTIGLCCRNFFGTNRADWFENSSWRSGSLKQQLAGTALMVPGGEPMPRTIDQIRANKLPSNMMQFAAKGALSVPPDENIEILVYLARHNKIFGDLARITLAGWDEKASLAAASDPKTPREVLDYLVAPENLRPKLLPVLLENPSVPESELAKFAISASRESIGIMLQSTRVRTSAGVLDSLRSNPYLKGDEAAIVAKLIKAVESGPSMPVAGEAPEVQASASLSAESLHGPDPITNEEADEVPDEVVSAYISEHATEIAAEKDKLFQPVGGIVDLLGADYFPVVENKEMAEIAGEAEQAKGPTTAAAEGNKEERSILIRDGTKVVALAVLDAPKISDGEVEKFALQKNVLEAVLRQIPMKRRFMKNYIVVRNLVSNPRTPLDLGLGLMKHLLVRDLKNISGNKEVSETVRNLALKMYKQKLDAANKK